MRRPVFADPVSTLARLSRRMALLGLFVVVLGAALTRFDMLDPVTGLSLLVGGVAVAALAVPIGIVAGIRIWNHGFGGARHAVLGVLLGICLTVPPVGIYLYSRHYPPITDVTTDPVDPPGFEVIGSIRGPQANPVTYPGKAIADIQRATYPDIRPLDLDLPADEINELVGDYVEEQRWRILSQTDYKGAQQEGHIEAVSRSLIMGVRDDIVVRVRQVNGRARIDIRSSARYGNRDFGANTRRVLAMLEELRRTGRRARQ